MSRARNSHRQSRPRPNPRDSRRADERFWSFGVPFRARLQLHQVRAEPEQGADVPGAIIPHRRANQAFGWCNLTVARLCQMSCRDRMAQPFFPSLDRTFPLFALVFEAVPHPSGSWSLSASSRRAPGWVRSSHAGVGRFRHRTRRVDGLSSAGPNRRRVDASPLPSDAPARFRLVQDRCRATV